MLAELGPVLCHWRVSLFFYYIEGHGILTSFPSGLMWILFKCLFDPGGRDQAAVFYSNFLPLFFFSTLLLSEGIVHRLYARTT